MEILSEAWQWSPDDKILNVLPLHHIHGIVNVLNCSLWNSARCELWEKPNSLELWKAFLRDDQDDDKLTIFMAVPTIYYNLIKCYDNNEITNITKEEIKKRLQRLRLMISGSAALPDSVKEKWE
jgi:malonyl-CoA/methylmalonyl-CoA synthetase